MSLCPSDYVVKQEKRDPKKIKIIEKEKKEQFQREKDLNIMKYRAAQAPGITGIKYMTSELTEDDLLTIRKVLIKDIIIDLRKTLITDTAHSSVGRVKDMHSDITKAVDRLYQILNEEVS